MDHMELISTNSLEENKNPADSKKPLNICFDPVDKPFCIEKYPSLNTFSHQEP